MKYPAIPATIRSIDVSRQIIFLLMAISLSIALCALSLQKAWADDAAPAAAATAPAMDYPALVAALPAAEFAEKMELVDKITATGDPKAHQLLQALLDDHLRSRKSDNKVFIVEEQGDALKLTDAITGQDAGAGNDDDFERVRTNNALRKVLKSSLAAFALADADPKVRKQAVLEMRRDLDEVSTAELRRRLADEKDLSVLRQINLALAMTDLQSTDASVRLKAVQTLDGETSPDIYNALKPLAVGDAGKGDPNDQVRGAATQAVKHIERWKSIYGSLEQLFFGLSLGSVLVLAATGLAITFGVMGVINMAHGELMMIGAYTAYVMQQLMPNHITAAIILAIPAAFIVSGLVGVLIERSVVRFLYGRPLETLLATFGVSLILQQAVRSIFSPLNRSVATPPFMSGSLQLTEAMSITWNRFYIILFAMIVFVVLQIILKRTSLGLKVRAVSQNRSMAKAMGIRTEWVDAATFGLGSGVAGMAGVALSQLTNVGPNLGQSYIIDSFMVVVFGGVGNLWGTIIGGMTLGVSSTLLEPAVGAVMAKILVLLFIILFIQNRKQGLFPQKGRAAEGH